MSYAAADAIVALHILQALVHMKISRQDHRGTAAINPNQTQTAETIATQTSLNNPQDFHKRSSHDRGATWLSVEGMYSCLLSLCQGIVDVAYKQPRRSSAPVGQVSLMQNCLQLRAYIFVCTLTPCVPRLRGVGANSTLCVCVCVCVRACS